MRKQHPVLLLAVVSALLMVVNGCVPEIQSLDETEAWNPYFGIPLITANIGMEDLLESVDTDGLLEVGNDSLLSVVYKETISVMGAPSIPPIPDFPIPVNDTDQNLPNPSDPDFRLDFIQVKEGQLSYSISNPFTEAVNVTISLTDIRMGSDILMWSFSIPAAPSPMPPTTQVDNMDISGYDIDFRYGFHTEYTATLANSGTSVDLHPFGLELSQLKFNYMEGYFGQFEIAIPGDSLSFGFLEKWEQGMLSFVDPTLSFNFRHNYGAPISITANQLSFETFIDGTQDITNTDIMNGFALDYPNTSQVGQLVTTPLELRSTNSNIAGVISGIPYQLDYDLTALANPATDPGILNHLLDEVQLDVDVECTIPIYGAARGFTFETIYELDLEELDPLERVGFKVVAENGFPIDVDLQIYFLDDAETVIDSLYSAEMTAPIMRAANIDNTGTVSEKVTTESLAEIDKDRFDALLKNAKAIKISTAIETPDDGSTPVRIFSYYDLTVKLGILAGL
jgi:hypothetical protein